MSEWHVEVVEIGKVGKLPNSDFLSITTIHGGYPVIFKTGDFNQGDLAVYVPESSIVPDTEQFHWLSPKPKIGIDGRVTDPGYPVGSVPAKYRRIKAKKIRGIYSQGMLIPALPGMTPGQIVDEVIGVIKYEEPEESEPQAGGQVEKGPDGWTFHKYTDIEPLRRYKNMLREDEDVVLMEKIHGQNARFCWDGERLWAGSRNEIKKEDVGINWWIVAQNLGLVERFAKFPMMIFYGEIYGKGIQKLAYGKESKDFVIFDTFDLSAGTYNNWDTTVAIAQQVGLPVVPVLYRGPWKGEELWHLAEGNSTVAGHVREGFVVKPLKERWDPYLGRVILKLVGEGYNLSK